MGDGAYQLAVLYEGTAGHALDYAPGLLQQLRVGDAYKGVFPAARDCFDTSMARLR